METLIAQAKGQFDQILSYIKGEAQNQQLNEVEKDIFWHGSELGNKKRENSREKAS